MNGSARPAAELSASPRDGFEHVPCAVCGADAPEPVVAAPNRDPHDTRAVRYQLVRCTGCGLHYVTPRPRPDRLGEFYPEHYYAYRQVTPEAPRGLRGLGRRLKRWADAVVRQAFFGYPVRFGAAERWGWRLIAWPAWLRLRLLGKDLKIVPYAGRGRFLDVGCGTGQMLAYQRQFGLDVAGVEPSASSARFAREQLGLDVRAGTLEQAGFPDASFDIIHLSHVFEHLPDPAASLREMRRILSPDGMIILKVPNIASDSAARFPAHWLGLELPRHLYHFDPATVTRLLGRHGFRVTAIRQDLGAWGFWRESWRLEAGEASGAPVPDPWWLAWWSKVSELAACLRGRGSAIAVYAMKEDA